MNHPFFSFPLLTTRQKIYKSQDAPRYLPGHCVCLAFLCLSVVSAALLKFLLKRENRRRDKEYGECTAVDLSQGSDEIEKLCDKHPKFRYAL